MGSEMPIWQGFAKIAVAPGLKTGRGLEQYQVNYTIWVGEWVQAGGDRNGAQLFVVNRHGKTLAHAASGMMKLKD